MTLEGGPIERVKKGKLPIPTPQQIIKETLTELAAEHGWDALKWAWNNIKKPLKKKKPAAPAGGGALVVIALVALATKKKRRR